MKTPFNKFLYIGFLLLGIYYTIFTDDYLQSASTFGIGMAFDPFDTNQKWTERPLWQKAILIIHILITLILLGIGIAFINK